MINREEYFSSPRDPVYVCPAHISGRTCLRCLSPCNDVNINNDALHSLALIGTQIANVLLRINSGKTPGSLEAMGCATTVRLTRGTRKFSQCFGHRPP